MAKGGGGHIVRCYRGREDQVASFETEHCNLPSSRKYINPTCEPAPFKMRIFIDSRSGPASQQKYWRPKTSWEKGLNDMHFKVSIRVEISRSNVNLILLHSGAMISPEKLPIAGPTEETFTAAFGTVLLPDEFINTNYGKAAEYEILPSIDATQNLMTSPD
ncbi:hypothetical protein IAQ61_008660, partial [Plenodomus lingam]